MGILLIVFNSSIMHNPAFLDGLQAKVNALRELQSATGEELPSVLDRAFKGEL